MFAFVTKGGLIMWPLLFLSVMSIAVAFHRFMLLWRLFSQAEGPSDKSAQSALRQIERGIDNLDLVATTAPLLGLIGTVFGIITCFHALGLHSGTPDTSLIANGLSEALFTTAAGLVIAVPAHFAAHFLQQGMESWRLRFASSESPEV